MQEWMAYYIALLATCIQWLTQMQLMGVSLLWIIIAFFILGVMFRAWLVKP